MRSISRKLCVRLFTLCKSRPQFCESCGTTYRRIWKRFSALPNTSGPVTDVENGVQIDALVTLSILKLVRNCPKNAVLNLALSCGANRRHREKSQYIGAQLQSILYTTAEKRFWKIYFL